jgi:hypothetical protein
VVGAREGRLDIAIAQLLVIVFAVIDEPVGGIDIEHGRRAGLDRVLDVENMRHRLPVDPDRLDRVARLRLRLGDHGCHRLALVAHALGGQHRLVVDAEIEQAQKRVEIRGHIGAGEDAQDTGHARCFTGVDPTDSGGVMRRAHTTHVRQTFELVVVIEGRPARDVADNVLTASRLADLVEIVVALVGEELLSELHHRTFGQGCVVHARTLPSATSRIAAMIGS